MHAKLEKRCSRWPAWAAAFSRDEGEPEGDAADRRQAAHPVCGGRGGGGRHHRDDLRHRPQQARDRGPLRQGLRAETELERKNKDVLLDMVRSVLLEGVRCIYIRQAEPLGLGHAVLRAAGGWGRSSSRCLADDLIDAQPPAMCRMAEIFAQTGSPRRGGGAEKPDAELRHRHHRPHGR